MQVQPYVFFDGRCEEVLVFYREKLGAEILFQKRFSEAPPGPCHGPSDKIMHAAFRVGNSEIMASDGQCQTLTHTGFGLSILVNDFSAGKKIFEALSEDGQVKLAWQKTFWTEGFGMVTDKFGIPWMVNVGH